jgi:hypothetical protein
MREYMERTRVLDPGEFSFLEQPLARNGSATDTHADSGAAGGGWESHGAGVGGAGG